MEFTLNKETMKFEPVKQPFKVVEIRCETEKDYNDFEKIIALNQPKKPVKSEKQVIRHVTMYECPNCGRQFTGNGLLNYCYHCGQSFDWSDKMGGEE